jgi:hypothetical protein
MGVCIIVLCSLATETSFIDPSVQIVTKSPKDEPILIFFISGIYYMFVASLVDGDSVKCLY